jgi:hypothetical protein
MSDNVILAAGVQNILGRKAPKKRKNPAKRARVLDADTALYRHFDKDGRLLYVGISVSAGIRNGAHKHTASWFKEITSIKIEQFQTRRDAELAEHIAISEEAPLHNSKRWRRYFDKGSIAAFKARMELEKFCARQTGLVE